MDIMNWELENEKPSNPARENPDWPETRVKVLDEVEEWYWKYGYLLWDQAVTRNAQRELRRILFPYGGGDVS